jgi:hypothetical protein
MSQFIYIVYLREFINNGKNIFKIGRTKNSIQRISDYPKGSKMLFMIPCSEFIKCESEIIRIFIKKYNQMKEFGTEYFEGDIKDMIATIILIVQEKYFELTLNKISEKEQDIFDPPNSNEILNLNNPNSEYITEDFINNIFKDVKTINYTGIFELIKFIYFNRNHPENHSIHIKTIKTKEIWVLEDGKWVSYYYQDIINRILFKPVKISAYIFANIKSKLLKDECDDDIRTIIYNKHKIISTLNEKPSKTLKNSIFEILCKKSLFF